MLHPRPNIYYTKSSRAEKHCAFVGVTTIYFAFLTDDWQKQHKIKQNLVRGLAGLSSFYTSYANHIETSSTLI